MQQWAHMQSLVRLFLVSGDGIYHSSSAALHPYRCSSKKFMTYDFTLLQTLIFIFTPLFVLLALSDDDDEDGPPDSGVMSPVFEGAS